MCAISAAKRGRKVVVLEHNDSVGKKIRISGGGRCNFTNLDVSRANYISNNPHFCTSALARYSPHDFISLVEKHGINYHEKKLGQLFCNGNAQQIIDMLVAECKENGVEILTHCSVKSISKCVDKFNILTSFGEFSSESLVIATGGLSIPALGATDFSLRIAKQFGLQVISPRPALVPLLFSKKDASFFAQLSGISLEVEASCTKSKFLENILFTHRGISGPAILQISNFWKKGKNINLDLLPNTDIRGIFEVNSRSKRELSNLLAEYFPKRFAEVWCSAYFPSKPMNQISTKELDCLSEQLHQWEISPIGDEGFEKAEVMAGGVDTNELSSKTMEAKNVKGLYFIGEAVDVTGWLGGYNFQWAWSSSFAAGSFA